MKIKIKGTGSAVPKLRVTNDDLSKLMDTSDEWIRSRTGIGARHLAVEETTTGLAVAAAKEALKDAEMTAKNLILSLQQRLRRISFCRTYPVKCRVRLEQKMQLHLI